MSHNKIHRALVVIDVQNEYVTGNFRIEYPDVNSSLDNIRRAMDAADENGIPIVVVQHVSPGGAPIFARGTHGVELHPVVATRRRAHLIEKTLPSVFAGTDFHAWIKANDIDTLTVVGYMTHNCNDSTMRQAMHEGLDVEFLPDAAGSLPYRNRAGAATAEEIHRATTVVMHSAFAAVMSTDEWIAMLASGAAPERDNVFLSNQRAIAHRVAPENAVQM
ncbi:nicotinamidase-related amidase [Luteibacter rhizovicinus]|uniref:Nicotinamidase-related amidase n=1 Tax=Luteibacter rhizovicinus TaxID=242606 RepID=A0A4R3YM76_9GAMM|nr:cysteine hydrolase family protein [Luteibacter rhizovicinus]TCV93361.1 nicotinamidase-related amidase [Luteibacter rhizovicinus]